MCVSTWVSNGILITRVTNIPIVTVVTDGPFVTSVTVVKLVIKVASSRVLRLRQNCFGLWTSCLLFFLCEYSSAVLR